jgi:esterase/lipase
VGEPVAWLCDWATVARVIRDPSWTAVRLALAAVGLTLLLAACAAEGKLEPRHAPSGLQTPLPEAHFAAYVAQAKTEIAAANTAIHKPLDPKLVEERAPFELQPDGRKCRRAPDGRYERAVLLIHGLGGTPYQMRDLGERFAAACYLVRAILLPGHGTVPGDLLKVGYGAWTEATRLGAASFAGEANRLYLVGLGAGATLALEYALGDSAANAPPLGGLVLLAPALASPGRLEALARSYLGLGAPGAVDGFAPLLPDDDPVRYLSIARNARTQLDDLIDRLDEREGLLTLPVFLVLSADDVTIDVAAARHWFCRELIGPRALIWYAPGAEPVGDCRFVEPRASDSWPGILDFAHPALPIAPDDPHYGVAGSYLDCSHYWWQTDTPNWLICQDPARTPANSAVRYGEITPDNLAAHVMRRLTFNPDFDALVAAMLDFLAAQPPSPPVPIPKPRA